MTKILLLPCCIAALASILVASCKSKKPVAEVKPETVTTTPAAAPAITYNGFIKNIIDKNCVSCHKLGTYESVKALGAGKNFLGAINHEQGFAPMPKNSGKLDDETIMKISSWVYNGMPE